MSAFEAQFPGRCAACDEQIRVGQTCIYVADDVVHLDCDASAPVEEVLPEICETCWLCHPKGECDR